MALLVTLVLSNLGLGVDCGGTPATCDAVMEAMTQAARAERVALAADGGVADFELVAKVRDAVVFFEVRARGAVTFFALTDESDYRLTHSGQDAAVLIGVLTVGLAPIALQFREPTTMADRSRAWVRKARKLIGEAVLGKATYFGATTAQGPIWTVRFGAPVVLRRPVVEEGTILVKDEDFEPTDAASVEAREAAFSASLVLPALLRELEAVARGPDAARLAPGAGTLVLQIVEGRFHRSFLVRGTPGLLSAIPMPARIPTGTVAMPLPGATRLLIPITLSRSGKR